LWVELTSVAVNEYVCGAVSRRNGCLKLRFLREAKRRMVGKSHSSGKILSYRISFGRHDGEGYEHCASSWKALRSFVSFGRRSDDGFEGYAAEVESFVSLERPTVRPCTLAALLCLSTVAMRLLICTSSSVWLARDPKGSPEGTKSGTMSLPSKERVHEVRVCCACVGSLGGRGWRVRAAGQPVVSGTCARSGLAQVVPAGNALIVLLFSPNVLPVGSGRFTAEYRSSSDNPGRHLWSDRGFRR
jgi:hypothetical protein